MKCFFFHRNQITENMAPIAVFDKISPEILEAANALMTLRRSIIQPAPVVHNNLQCRTSNEIVAAEVLQNQPAPTVNSKQEQRPLRLLSKQINVGSCYRKKIKNYFVTSNKTRIPNITFVGYDKK